MTKQRGSQIIFPTVRDVLVITFIIVFVTIPGVENRIKTKHELEKATGVIEYFDKESPNEIRPKKGEMCYLKLSSYSYRFEIHKPSNTTLHKTIDDLRKGDSIDIYYFETFDTKWKKLNNSTQFIDKNGEAYYIKNDFQKNLGIGLIVFSVLLNVLAFVFWKFGKMNW